MIKPWCIFWLALKSMQNLQLLRISLLDLVWTSPSNFLTSIVSRLSFKFFLFCLLPCCIFGAFGLMNLVFQDS